MIKQKKITNGIQAIVFLFLLGNSNLFAQPQRHQGPPPMPDSTRIIQMVDELGTNLSLNEKQIIEISNLHFTHFAEAKDLMKKHKTERDSHRLEMDSLREDFEEQVKSLLTDDQKTEFAELMKKHRPGPGNQRPKHKKQ